MKKFEYNQKQMRNEEYFFIFNSSFLIGHLFRKLVILKKEFVHQLIC
jgi:hypothetical protein